MFRFYLELDNNKNILIKDATINKGDLPSKIDSFKLNIFSSKLSGGSILNIDILNYLYLSRENKELFKITPSLLGFSNGIISDGTYKIVFTINGTIEIEYIFAYLVEIENKIFSLVGNIDTNIDIEDNTIFTENIPFDIKHSKIYYIIAVYFKLLILTSDIKDVVEVNDLIDKLQRLLLI